MSRTYRRTGMPPHMVWTLKDWRVVDGRAVPFWLDTNSKEGRKAINKYRADGSFGNYSHATPPRWYRHMLNRQFDRKEQQELYRWEKYPDYEVPSRKRQRNAGWYW